MGDKVLQEMANIINKRLRTSDVFGRFGGEEFIICTIEQDDKGAQLIAEDIRQAVAAHRFEEGLQLTISIGVADPVKGSAKPSSVIKAADQALYRAKKRGRNCLAT